MPPDLLIDALVSNGALLASTAVAVMAIMAAEYRSAPGRRQRSGAGLRSLADLIKLASKRSSRTTARSPADWAPALLLASSFTALAVIPFCAVAAASAHSWTALAGWGGSASRGLLYAIALGSLGMHAGLAAGQRAGGAGMADFGGLRLVARMLSSYLALGIAALGVILSSGTTRFDQLIMAQTTILGPGIPEWNVFVQPLGFAVFVVAAIQISPWRPLMQRDPTRGGRLGCLYSGRQLALLLVAERVHLIAAAALVVTLYLGGWHLPGLVQGGGSALPASAVQVVVTVAKTAVVVLFFLWVRASLPSLALERAATFGWKLLLPVAFANLALTALAAALLPA